MTTKEQERKVLAQIKKLVESLGENSYVGTAFEGCFEKEEAVVKYIDEHPELKAAPNTEDMWDYRNEDEDVDRDDEEDEEDDYYEYYYGEEEEEE